MIKFYLNTYRLAKSSILIWGLLILFSVASQNIFAQVPQIESFSPASGPIGTVVTISGSNFSSTAASNIVYFGAVRAFVTTATSTSLTVTCPSGATYQPITVTTNNYTASSLKPFVVTYSGGTTSFNYKRDFITGTSTTSTTPVIASIADLDNDGKPDLIVNNLAANTFSIFKNNSSNDAEMGTSFSLENRVDYSTDEHPSNVSAGDLDGDGKLDLVVPQLEDGSVAILRNTSSINSISFASKIKYYTGTSPRIAAILDIDGDGKSDLAVVNEHSATISVLRNTSSPGSISFATKVDFYTNSNPRDLSSGDIDGDGKTDLVCSNFGYGNVTVYKNNSTIGSVSLSSVYSIYTGGSPRSATIADFDGDNKADIAIANYSNSSVYIAKNSSSSGSVSFDSGILISNINNAYGITSGDVDGDGKIDLFIGKNTSEGGFSFLKNNHTTSSISFAPKVDYATGSGTQFVTMCDLDADYHPELIAANYFTNTISILSKTTVLPVHLTKFTGNISNTGAILEWHTTVDANATHFDVEQFVDNSYVSIGTVKANNTGSYKFLDQNISEPFSYYRLKIFNSDGTFKHSEIIKVEATFDNTLLTIFPNPTKSTVTVKHPAAHEANIQVFNLQGKQLSKLMPAKESIETKLDLTFLSPGIYVISWRGDGQQLYQKLIKE